MLLQAPQPATNGQNPPNPQRVARQAARVASMSDAMAAAKQAVLGNCTNPASYASVGMNLMADISQTQAVAPLASLTAASGASTTGAGGYSSADVVASPAPVVTPMGAAGLPAPPTYAPLTTTQNATVPLVSAVAASSMTMQLPGSGSSCSWMPSAAPGSGSPQQAAAVQVVPPSGQSWGSAPATTVPVAVPSPLALLALAGVALLIFGMESN